MLAEAPRPRRERVLLESAVGRVLARDVRADRDIPPFDRAALDGYAVHLPQDHGPGDLVLPVVARIVAGRPWSGRLIAGQAAAITTGAPTPAGTERVVAVERTELVAADRVRLPSGVAVGPIGIAPRGEDAGKGDVVLRAGARLAPMDVAVLAGVGVTAVTVTSRPDVLILTTGDEIVPPGERPRWHEVRDSNGPLLRALLGASGWVTGTASARVADRPGVLRQRLERARQSVIVLTGGVSMGERDFVPDALRAAGFRVHFHRAALRPGKPVLFATRGRGSARQAAFGLPGNPVSVLVTAWELLLPFLRAAGGASDPGPHAVAARVTRAFERPPGFTHFVPVALVGRGAADEALVSPVGLHGSGDYVALGRAHGFALLPPASPRVDVGDSVIVHFFHDEPMLRGAREEER